MIQHQKRFSIILLIALSALVFFNTLPNVNAAEIHSFSINNEGKYFIYYWDGADLSKVKAIRDEAIRVIPLVEQWGGLSFDKLEIDIVPDSFEEYQAVYKNTDILKIHSFTTPNKESYANVAARALPGYNEFFIKESYGGAIYHEASHLAEYPFSFDKYFSEGAANAGADFTSKKLGVTLSGASLREVYNQLSPEERKVYGTTYSGLEQDKINHALIYPVGTIFIENLLEKAGVEDLSAFYTTLRNDFSDIVAKYPKNNLYFSFVADNGQEMFISSYGFIDFNSVEGQEMVQCELIKTYGNKVAPVFAEFGYPGSVNCDAKISAFKEEKLKTLEGRLSTIRDNIVTAHERKAVIATEPDQWIGSELIENKKSESTDVSQVDEDADSLPATSANEKTSSGATTSSKDMALIIIVSIGIFILTVIAVYLIKKNQNKTNTKS